MKKYIYLLMFALVSGFWGCYDDKSTYDTGTLPDIKIDVENMSKNINVSYLGNLKLDVPVSKDGVANHADLGYEWQIEYEHGVTEVLSNERVLDVTVTMAIRANAYPLLLTVTDSATDLRYYSLFSVFVGSEFRDGLVVAHSRDGQTSDLTLIMDEHLTYSYTGERKVVSDIYASKGTAFPDKINTLTYTIFGSTWGNYTNILWVTGEQGIYRIDVKDYAYTTTKSIVPMESEPFVAEGFHPSSQTTLMVANQKVYMHLRQNDQIFIKPERPMNDYGVESNHVDNSVIAVAIRDNGNSGNAVWYDSSLECFGRFNSYYASPKFALFSQSEYNEALPFNPAKVPNKTAVAGGMTGGNVLTMLLKDKSSQDYDFYLFKYVSTEYNMPLTPYMKYSVDAKLKSILDAAISFSFSTVDPILYVATKTEVYAVRMDLNELSYESKYTVANGEEISIIKVFQEGWYSMYPDSYEYEGGRDEILPLHTKALMIAVQSGDNGKIYLVPSKDSGTGNLDKANQIKYEGFGVISDVVMQGK